MSRPQPQLFAFTLLPQLVARRPVAVRHELSDPLLARELLLYLWNKAGADLPPRERVAPRGLHLSWHRVAGRPTALLQLPAVQATGEAHLVAVVYPPGEGPPAPPPRERLRLDPDDEEPEAGDELPDFLLDVDDPVAPRYFVLEATLGRSLDDGATPTRLGELRGDYYHYEPGPPAGRPDTAGAFLQALANRLGPLPGPPPLMRVVRD